MNYSLNNGLSWCVCAGRTVFLDLLCDRYFCLAPDEDEVFQRWVAGDAPAAAERLCGKGVLVRSETRSGDEPVKAPPMFRDLADRAFRPTFGQVLHAAFVQKRAEHAVRRRPLHMLIRQFPAISLADAPRPDAALAHASAVSATLAAAALLIRKSDRCLPRALAARLLCARRGLATSLVFGVRTEPFAAHCWVQWQDAVIVGDLEEARMFTPVLVVS